MNKKIIIKLSILFVFIVLTMSLLSYAVIENGIDGTSNVNMTLVGDIREHTDELPVRWILADNEGNSIKYISQEQLDQLGPYLEKAFKCGAGSRWWTCGNHGDAWEYLVECGVFTYEDYEAYYNRRSEFQRGPLTNLHATDVFQLQLTGECTISTLMSYLNNVSSSPLRVLEEFQAVYCLKHHKAVPSYYDSWGITNSFSTKGKVSATYDKSTRGLSSGDRASWSYSGLYDYLDGQKTNKETQITKSNVEFYLTNKNYENLKNISTGYGSYSNTNVFTYSLTYSRKAESQYHTGGGYELERAQNAMWLTTGDAAVANASSSGGTSLHTAALSVDMFESELSQHHENIVVSKKTGNSEVLNGVNVGSSSSEPTGTTIGKNAKGEVVYKIGPFSMSDYAYVSCAEAAKYSGASSEVTVDKSIVGGIIYGEIALNNGKKIPIGYNERNGGENKYISNNTFVSGTTTHAKIVYNSTSDKGAYNRSNGASFQTPSDYQYPWPNSTFYIEVPKSVCGNATNLTGINFEYRKTSTAGHGWIITGKYVQTEWKVQGKTDGCLTYYSKTAACGSRHHKTVSHYTNAPVTVTWDHTYADSCGKDCTGSCGGTAENPSSCGSCCNGGHPCNGSETGKCSTHGYEQCIKFHWEHNGGNSKVLLTQPFLAAHDSHVYVNLYQKNTSINVRLTTNVTIDKYISKVDHVGEAINAFNSTARQNKSDSEKSQILSNIDNKTGALRLERGDRVTYNIVLNNTSNYRVKLRVKDILPEYCIIENVKLSGSALGIRRYNDNTYHSNWSSNSGNAGENKWLITDWFEVPNGKTTVTIQIIATAANSSFTNKNRASIVTGNEGRVLGNNGVTKDDKSINYMRGTSALNNCAVVNLAQISGGNLYNELHSSDYYVIKEHDVSIEKYINDVTHNKSTTLDNSGMDTTLGTTTQRSVQNAFNENKKKANPVYVEYGDKVTYKIVLYNTTNSYAYFNSRNNTPYWAPNKVYVNVEDVLPKKYSGLTVSVSNSYQNYSCTATQSTNGGKFNLTNVMVPENGTTTITVNLVVEEYEKDKIEENKASLIGKYRNINYSKSYSQVDNRCQVKNDSTNLVTSDFYKLNNYNAFMDKYLYSYNESKMYENEMNGYLEKNEIATKTDNIGTKKVLNESRERWTEATKRNKPLSAEKGETVIYALKVKNEAQTVNNTSASSGSKPATQIRTSVVTDYMQVGLVYQNVKARIFNEDGSICDKYGVGGYVNVSDNGRSSQLVDIGGTKYNKYTYTIDNKTILNPGQFIVYYVTATIDESNMYLGDLTNTAELTELTNINHPAGNSTRKVKTSTYNENISNHQTSSDYIRMKDLVIGGFVWLDLDRDGYMNDTVSTYNQNTGFENNQIKDYYNINDKSMKKDIVVRLYQDDGTPNGKLLRTTLTDKDGQYTFAKDENMEWLTKIYNYEPPYDSSQMYQRVDKADNKDQFGNYKSSSKLIKYFIEYEYDGILYKSTEIYAGKDNINNDGSYTPNYLIDSNASEFKDVRESFNNNYEYYSYNIAYNVGKSESTEASLKFDKTNHTSQLIENSNRIMTSRSFIIKDSNKSSANTNKLWLYSFESNSSNTLPETDYLKHINLGLELREDVDVSLTKDVYSVVTYANGQEIEYDLNQNTGINGKVGNGSNASYLKDYIISKPYGIDLYESDYKYRFNQYESEAVQEYKGKESELETEVTYRITIDNNRISDDDITKKNYKDKTVRDTSLDVRISEILDLYDQNFIEFNGNDKDNPNNLHTVKTTNAEKFLENKDLRICDAWYYEENTTDGTLDRYTISNQKDVDNGAKPIYIEDNTGKYIRKELNLSKTSSGYSDKTKVDQKDNNKSRNIFTDDGYNTLYITGMENVVIKEGSSLDIYVKYTLDKDSYDITISNTTLLNEIENYMESTTGFSDTVVYNGRTYKINYSSSSHSKETITTIETSYERSLSIPELVNLADHEYKNKYGRGIENLAQINAYSVWYETGKPASLVDMDSNAGNIGDTNTNLTKTDGLKRKLDVTLGNPTSSDNIDFYEDSFYKTGVEITAENTLNTRKKVKDKEAYKGFDIFIETGSQDNSNILRRINGTVWDDSRNASIGSGGATQYIGNGSYNKDEKPHKDSEKIKINENVTINYKDENVTEKTDIPVKDEKVEFVEIVQTKPNMYYEQILRNVTWEQVQTTRTNDEGKYTLTGMIPGRYIVRFTYGSIDEKLKDLNLTEAQKNMLIFNGQDYKATQYNSVLDTELDDDLILKKLEEESISDARDDELRRLQVNEYSEVMVNYIAEILKGLANNTVTTHSNITNTAEQLNALAENTSMNAETVEFLVKPEYAKGDSSTTYSSWHFNGFIRTKNGQKTDENMLYQYLKNYDFKDLNTRTYNIDNIDFGIEYRPEAEISLTKEIDEIKIVTEDNKTLIDLLFKVTDEGQSSLIHEIDLEKSTGLDKVQFDTNTYTKLFSGLDTEKLQGFVYIQIEDEVLHGTTIEITYRFYADNHSEVDRISERLNNIRYKNNSATQALVTRMSDLYPEYNIIDPNYYTANGTAYSVAYIETYENDNFSDHYLYRNKKKTLTSNPEDEKNGYYGKFIGYSYYNGKETDNPKMKEVVSELKFDKLLDYVDTDLEYNTKIKPEELNNNYWQKVDSTVSTLTDLLLRARKENLQNTLDDQSSKKDNSDELDVKTNISKLENIKGIEYDSLVLSIDDRIVDMNDANEAIVGKHVINDNFSRFLTPEVYNKDKSRAMIYLPVSKVVSAETTTDSLSYENIAEVVQYTTLTGRRTNFETTIGNADIQNTKLVDPNYSSKGSVEFATASYESDTAGTETITLIPPTGLMRNRKTIVNVVDKTKTGVIISSIGVSVVVIGVFVTNFAIRKYKKRRIK